MEARCYAQLNDENICVGVAQLTGEINDDKLLPVESLDSSLLNKLYENGGWHEIQEPEPEEEVDSEAVLEGEPLHTLPPLPEISNTTLSQQISDLQADLIIAGVI